jgi:hypothetical protein
MLPWLVVVGVSRAEYKGKPGTMPLAASGAGGVLRIAHNGGPRDLVRLFQRIGWHQPSGLTKRCEFAAQMVCADAGRVDALDVPST